MSKELEVLKRLRKCLEYGDDELGDVHYSKHIEDLDLIETTLKENEYLKTELLGQSQELNVKNKALETIKEKRVEIRVIFHTNNAMEYNEKTRQYYDCYPLTQEEYDLLKEVLL